MMMRGGHIDVTVLGAFQVSERGDLANWAHRRRPHPPAVGGAMDLAVGAKRVLVMTTHTTRDGRPKLLTALHLSADRGRRWSTGSTPTSPSWTSSPTGFLVREMAPGVTPRGAADLTAAQLAFADDLRELET